MERAGISCSEVVRKFPGICGVNINEASGVQKKKGVEYDAETPDGTGCTGCAEVTA